jgi:hypothetical protein
MKRFVESSPIDSNSHRIKRIKKNDDNNNNYNNDDDDKKNFSLTQLELDKFLYERILEAFYISMEFLSNCQTSSLIDYFEEKMKSEKDSEKIFEYIFYWRHRIRFFLSNVADNIKKFTDLWWIEKIGVIKSFLFIDVFLKHKSISLSHSGQKKIAIDTPSFIHILSNFVLSFEKSKEGNSLEIDEKLKDLTVKMSEIKNQMDVILKDIKLINEKSKEIEMERNYWRLVKQYKQYDEQYQTIFHLSCPKIQRLNNLILDANQTNVKNKGFCLYYSYSHDEWLLFCEQIKEKEK